MKVLHVVNYGWPWIDGYTVRSQGLISAQARVLGWDVEVVTGPFAPLTGARDPHAWTPVWVPDPPRLGRPPGPLARPGLGLAPRTAKHLRRDAARSIASRRPDLVHVHHPHYLARPVIAAARHLGVPVVYEIRCFNGDYDLARGGTSLADRWARRRGAFFNRLEGVACRAADAVVTISEGLARRVRRAAPEQDVFVVRNSVDPRWLGRDGSAQPSEGGREGVGRFRVGYATTFERIEGLDRLVEVFARLSPAQPPAELVIAGTGADWRRIDGLVRGLGRGARIELPGFVPFSRMGELLATLDLFVVPRFGDGPTRETPPLKPLEAMAAGVPVLAPDLPALRELLGGRRGVRLFEPTADGLLAGLERARREPIEPPGPEAVADRTWDVEVERYREVAAAVGAGEGRGE